MQESTISIEHFRFIMQSLPKGDDMTRKGKFLNCRNVKSIKVCFDIYQEMNDLVDEMISEVDDGDGEIDYEEFVKMIQKY